MADTGYMLWSSFGALGGAVIIWVVFTVVIARALHAGSSRAVAVPAGKRVVNWRHVADMERDIFGHAFHHEDVACCCSACKPARAGNRTGPGEKKPWPAEDERLAAELLATAVARAHAVSRKGRHSKAEPAYGTREWQEAYERGRRETQARLGEIERAARPGDQIATMDPTTLKHPIDITAIHQGPGRWYIEGDPR